MVMYLISKKVLLMIQHLVVKTIKKWHNFTIKKPPVFDGRFV